MRFVIWMALACAGWLIATPAQAWSAFGHRLVALLAQDQLSDPARAQLDALLEQEPDANIGTIASWPDEIRAQPGYEHTGAFHYVNFKDRSGQKDRSCQYVAARDCAGGACVVAALPQHHAELSDRGRSDAERLIALKFVVHLVGDVHQPFHAGNRDDRGGNQFQVRVGEQGTNLHGVWDYHVLNSAGLKLKAYRKRLEPRVAATLAAATDATNVVDWAEASCALLDSENLYPKRPGNLPEGYLEQKRPLAEAQIVAAAARLALILEKALGPGEKI